MEERSQSTDLESERNLRMKRERMEVSLQLAKIAVNVPNAHCLFILPVVIFAFTSGEVIEDKIFS